MIKISEILSQENRFCKKSWRTLKLFLVHFRMKSTTGRIDYMGGGLSAADQAMHRLLNEDS